MSGGEGVAAEDWLGASVEQWRQSWALPMLRIYRTTGSTNDVARALAERGAPEGAVVIAEEQTRGRGQRGRPWSAPAGAALLLSMVLRPLEVGAERVIPLRLGLAAAGAIEGVAGVAVRIKWPNDLLVRDRKLAGLLCEAALERGRAAHVIAGIGINVAQRPADWPPELRASATSLQIEAGRPVERDALAGAVIEAMRRAAREPSARLQPAELDAIAQRDALRGRPITIDDRPAGVADGIDADGALVVHRDGYRTRIVAGTVRPAATRETQ